MNPRRFTLWLAAALTASALLPACAAGSRYSYAPAQRAAMAPPPMQPSIAAEAVAAPSGGDVSDGAPPAPAPPGGAPARPAPAPRSAMPGGPAANASQPRASQETAAAQGAATTPAAPMLIYTADLRLQVERERFDAVLDQVLGAAREMGGYLVRRDDASIQVRVPSARFHEGLRTMEEMGEVLRRHVSAEDVSEEYRDAEVRLQNLRAVRQRLEEFLRRASNMAEALQVERELERVTQEIDRIEGRMRFLSARVAFSLVTVSLQARPTVIAAPRTTVIPPRRMVDLPVQWLRELGLERLLNLGRED